jgi:hypothetical protein
MMPQVLFIYFVMPYYGLLIAREEMVFRGGSWQDLSEFQAIVLLMALSLQAGIWLGSRRGASSRTSAPMNENAIFEGALAFGFLGLAAWLIGIMNVGGFEAAYGKGYGGGWDDSGYVREASQLGIVAIPFLMFARRSRGMSRADWALALVLISPLLIHGLLGARRGPTFIGLATIAASYIIIFRPRVPFVVALSGAAATGMLLLFLVANRGSIYLGSTSAADAPITTIMENWSGSEYLFSSAIYRYVQITGDSFNGLRILLHEMTRIIPSAVWPHKWTEFPEFFNVNVDFTKLDGIPAERIADVVGWDVAVGAAPGFVGDFWMEFGLGAPLAVAAVGWTYGRFWRRSRSNPAVQPIYILFVALSIYIITQGIDAWLFRCLLYGIPAWGTLKLLERRRSLRYVPAQRNIRVTRRN